MDNFNKPNISFELQVAQDGGVYDVLKIGGNMDKLGLDEIKEKVEAEVETVAASYLVLDLASLNFINSESIGFVLTLHYRLLKREKKLVIVNAPDNVKDVLSVIGLLKIIDNYDTFDAFKATINN